MPSPVSLLFLFLTAFSFLPLAHASFEDTGTGARASALSGAFAAVADDVHALYYNPSGLVYLKRKEISATYGLLHTGLTDKSKFNSSYVAYGHPLKSGRGGFGLSYHQNSLDGLYGERIVSLGYGHRFAQRWAMGMNLKQLYREFTAPAGGTSNSGVIDPTKTDPAFASGNSRANYGMDMGVLFRPYRNYAYALTLQNVNEPDMAISDKDHDPLPMTIRTGLAYQERSLMLSGELDSRKSPGGKRDYNFAAGAEKWWYGAGFAQGDLAVRGSLAFGSRSFSQMAFGLTYRLSAVQIDYGIVMPLSGISFGNSQGNHRVSLTMRFGATVAEADYELRMRAAEIAAKKAELELERVKEESEKLAEEIRRLKQESEKRKVEIQAVREKGAPAESAREYSRRFLESMERYWRRKSEGAPVEERMAILSGIIEDFGNTGVDVSTARKELAVVKSDQAKSEVEFLVSWNYYQKIVARGASVPEQIELLSRMIERFARRGVDLAMVKDELKALRSRKP